MLKSGGVAQAHWFAVLSRLLPDLKTHFVTLDLPATPRLSDAERALIRHRTMQVRRLKVLPIEAIVRGHITGSAWTEYQRSGTVHGIAIAPGLQRSQAFPDGPIYTPSTKAEAGEHDENIHPSEAARIIGDDARAARVEELALQVFKLASEYARERGIVIADTKFEFGLLDGELVLIDECLTPDSSRFWPASEVRPGGNPTSFDKQYLRDWLSQTGWDKTPPPPHLPPDVVAKTATTYREIQRRLTNNTTA
jgi:phosphoribosylaminoimidazole-succinocarboxamide synthase